MNCKNCQTPQRTDYNYCPACGAKVIRNRLTFRNLWYDVTERYFNLDNTFIKTVVQLCVRPEVVIENYISGVRRKFLNPISHLGIALTLSGLQLFVMQKVFKSDLFLTYSETMSSELSAKLSEALFDYSTFMFILYIPVFALAGYLTFNKKEYVLSEHIIAYIYVFSQWSILIFPIFFTVLLIDPSVYMGLSFPFLFLMFGYCIYVMQRIHRFSAGNFILRSIAFLMLSGIGYFAIVIGFYIVLFLTGTIEMQDFLPKK
jgi:hypothetical protein